MEKEIFFIQTREFASKEGTKYYNVDYVRLDGGKKRKPKTDYISALEYVEINKKMKDKDYSKCIGVFSVNDYDQFYLSAIK